MEYENVIVNADDLKDKINEKIEGFKIEIGMILDDSEEYMRVAHVLNEEEEKNKFKVGDVITGKNNEDYSITNNESVLIVTDVIDDYEIKVKVISHKEMPAEVGQFYQVMGKHFKLITDIL